MNLSCTSGVGSGIMGERLSLAAIILMTAGCARPRRKSLRKSSRVSSAKRCDEAAGDHHAQ